MNKSAGIVVGVVAVVAAVAVGGAWYTGTRIDGELRDSVAQANQQLQKAMEGAGGKASLELVSLDRHLFSSTAHYRVQIQDDSIDGGTNIDLLLVDNLEHGPFPVSRLKALKLLPVAARSNLALEPNAFTEKWFKATKGVAPFQAHADYGYDRSATGTIELVPIDYDIDSGNHLNFSGLVTNIAVTAGAQKIRAEGKMDSLVFSMASPTEGKSQLELHDLTLSSDQYKGVADMYLGKADLKLGTLQAAVANMPAVVVKGIESSSSADQDGKLVNAHFSMDSGVINVGGKDFGSGNMAWSMKNLDAVALQSLAKAAQDRAKVQEAAAVAAPKPDEEGADTATEDQSVDSTNMTPAEEAKVKADIKVLLDAKPVLALDNLSLKTTNGESRFNFAITAKNPTSFDLPADEQAKQIVDLLDAKLVLSQPMVKDVASLYEQLSGQNDPATIAQQAEMMSFMASTFTVGANLAVQQGTDIVSSLHYANDEVDFNGKKMTPEEFVAMIAAKMQGAGE